MNAGLFSSSTQHVFKLARDEASLLAHDHIATEHLMLAMLGGDSQLSDRLLADLSIAEDKLTSEIRLLIQLGEMPFSPPKKFAFTACAKHAIEISMSEAGLELGSGRIVEREHLLIGLVVEPDNGPTAVTQAFKNCGVDLVFLVSLTRRYASDLSVPDNTESAT